MVPWEPSHQVEARVGGERARLRRQADELGQGQVPEVDPVGDQPQPRERRGGEHPSRNPALAGAEHGRQCKQPAQRGSECDRGQRLCGRLLGLERLRYREQAARMQEQREAQERSAGPQPQPSGSLGDDA